MGGGLNTTFSTSLSSFTLQVQGFESARYQFGQVQHYSGLVNCIVTIFRNEGLFGFFKGTQPTIIKVNRHFVKSGVEILEQLNMN